MIAAERGIDVDQADLHGPVREGMSRVDRGLGPERPGGLGDPTRVEGGRPLGTRVEGQDGVQVRSAPEPLAVGILAQGRPVLPRIGPDAAGGVRMVVATARDRLSTTRRVVVPRTYEC
jgi:hypothetical protein